MAPEEFYLEKGYPILDDIAKDHIQFNYHDMIHFAKRFKEETTPQDPTRCKICNGKLFKTTKDYITIKKCCECGDIIMPIPKPKKIRR